jgi:hypothetical protein
VVRIVVAPIVVATMKIIILKTRTFSRWSEIESSDVATIIQEKEVGMKIMM